MAAPRILGRKGARATGPRSRSGSVAPQGFASGGSSARAGSTSAALEASDVAVAKFLAFLARDSAQRCVCAELDYIYEDDAGSPQRGTLYFSDREYFDDVTDLPFVDVIAAAPTFSRALSGEQLGTYIASVGSLELHNEAGDLDFMRTLAIDGSEVRFFYGPVDAPYADFELIFTALSVKATAPSFDRISIQLKDTGLLLNKSIGGETTVGGAGPNAERARPLNFGFLHNLTALVADSFALKYVHSDAGLTPAVEVRDRGQSVSFTENNDGTFTLAATPAGLITCDVRAEPLGSDKVRVSDAMDYLIGERVGLNAAGRYAGAGPTYTRGDDNDFRVGLSLPEARNVIDTLSDLADAGNCFWAIKRTGEFTYGRLRLNDIASLGLTPTVIETDDLQAESMGAQAKFSIDHANTGYYRFQAFMSRNWTRQTDLASLLTPDEQATYSRPGLYLQQEDTPGTDYASAPQLYHKTLAVSPVLDTLLSREFALGDTDDLALWMTTRRAIQLPWIETVTILVGIDFYQLELGDVVQLTVEE